MRAQEEDSHLQANKRGLRGNQSRHVFPTAAVITNEHSDLKQYTLILLQFWKSEVQDGSYRVQSEV